MSVQSIDFQSNPVQTAEDLARSRARLRKVENKLHLLTSCNPGILFPVN